MKSEKMQYEEKMMGFVDKVVELQEALTLVNQDKEELLWRLDEKAREIDEYKKQIIEAHSDSNPSPTFREQVIERSS